MKDVCVICRQDATSKVFQKLRRRTSIKCFPQQTPKVRCSAEPSWRCILGPNSRPLTQICPGSSAVSVLERMLLLDPESRATAAEALALPYFTEFREPEEETEAQLYDHSLDNAELPLSQWKRKGRERGKCHRTEAKPWKLRLNHHFSTASLFFRSHIHRDFNLQACCVRSERNATVKQSAEQSGRCSFKKRTGEKLPGWKDKRLNCGFISFLHLYCDAGTGKFCSVG